ncbi:nuclear pore complex component-domain-containing protein [Echria macrotheca]|uniref:Nuclear pore complex component-domain-containing protein n=1 Tax=Echria macrotheca TaxID=438768 RepID=A0AAJ0BMU3_9PEZI|nr:nuclear pore complex component-domain-containing protein [Echria macrotheca]
MSSTRTAPSGRALMTPVKQTASIPPAKESPGSWRHPRLSEITQRQSRSVFSEKNTQQIVYNTIALVITLFARNATAPHLSKLLGADAREYLSWAYLVLLAIPVYNIIRACLPLFRAPDDLADIPLTPAQRKLLGLPPLDKGSPTPDPKEYSTPPRYSRTPSIVAGSPASLRSYNSSPTPNLASPLSVNNSPVAGVVGAGHSPRLGKLGLASPRSVNNSPAGLGSGPSPLLNKAIGGGGLRRSSFGGSSSQFGVSTATSLLGEGPSTPTPVGGKRSSVSLNNKWLYERGRRSSGNSWLHQGL